MKISQCMIVKNEERNLEKSLGNLKDIVYEQIVVDTGSTDNTVQVAQEMGAKVYHFDWIDDFSAAKNFAIEQATGDWIVFLDADEYIEKDKAEYLVEAIKTARQKKATVVRLEMFHLDENNKVFLKGLQDRIFLNRKDIRYSGKIHEAITSKRSDFHFLQITDIPIWHTGYVPDVVKEKDKGNRNIVLLKNEIEKDPSNSQLYNYLADALIISNQIDESLKYYKQAYTLLQKQTNPNKVSFMHAIHGILKIIVSRNELFDESEEIFKHALQNFPNDADIYFYMGQIYRNEKNMLKAIECFEKSVSLSILDNSSSFNSSLGKLYELNRLLLEMYYENHDLANAVKKAVLLLQYNKFDLPVAYRLVQILKTAETSKDIFVFLNRFYNYEEFKERYFLYKIFNSLEADELKQMLIQYFSKDEIIKHINLL